MASQYFISPYTGALSYQKYDAVYGIDMNGTVFSTPYFYATQTVPPGNSPSGVYVFGAASYTRSDDVTTLIYNHTGGLPFAPGSQVAIAGVVSAPHIHFTGMVKDGGSGWISYVNPGYKTSGMLAAGTITCLCPGWSSGYFFVPTYTTQVPTQNEIIETKLGGNYAQRMSIGVNTFSQSPTLAYRNIDKREMRAIQNFIQDSAGVRAFEILLNDTFLNNQPKQKFTAQKIDATPVSFERYDVNVMVNRVFDL